MKKLFALGVLVLFALGIGSLMTPTVTGYPCGSYTNNNTNFLFCGGRVARLLSTNPQTHVVYAGQIVSGSNVYNFPVGAIILHDPEYKHHPGISYELAWPWVTEGEPLCQELLEECISGLGVSGVYPDLDFTIPNNVPDYSGWEWLEIIGIVEAEVTEDENESCDYYSFWLILYDEFYDYAIVVLASRTDDYNCPSFW